MTLVIDPDCLACADCEEIIGMDPYRIANLGPDAPNAVVHQVCPRDRITEPGVYENVDPDTYHRDPIEGGSLSSSGARKLLPPGCPALYRWERDNPPPPKPHFDIGHAAHKLILGSGPPIVDTGLDNRRGNAWKNTEAEARAAGAVPLLTQDYAMVTAMADAIRNHPFARYLFDPDHGRPEVTLAWQDTGNLADGGAAPVWRRARLDWLPDRGTGRLIIPDYKTCADADPDALARACIAHGYHLQDDWYRAGCAALDLAGPEARFVFVFQEKAPPYLVHVVEMDHVAQRIGAVLNRQAINLYAQCHAAGRWPGYADDVTHLQLPAWYENQYGE